MRAPAPPIRRRPVLALLLRTCAGRWVAREWGPRRSLLRRVRRYRATAEAFK